MRDGIIVGYSNIGYPYGALTFLNDIQLGGIKPNLITVVSVLFACVDLLAPKQGKWIQGDAVRIVF